MPTQSDFEIAFAAYPMLVKFYKFCEANLYAEDEGLAERARESWATMQIFRDMDLKNPETVELLTDAEAAAKLELDTEEILKRAVKGPTTKQ